MSEKETKNKLTLRRRISPLDGEDKSNLKDHDPDSKKARTRRIRRAEKRRPDWVNEEEAARAAAEAEAEG